MAMKSEHT